VVFESEMPVTEEAFCAVMGRSVTAVRGGGAQGDGAEYNDIVGAGLPAKAVGQATALSAEMAYSQASLLPQ
jgi:hypothetical protein